MAVGRGVIGEDLGGGGGGARTGASGATDSDSTRTLAGGAGILPLRGMRVEGAAAAAALSGTDEAELNGRGGGGGGGCLPGKDGAARAGIGDTRDGVGAARDKLGAARVGIAGVGDGLRGGVGTARAGVAGAGLRGGAGVARAGGGGTTRGTAGGFAALAGEGATAFVAGITTLGTSPLVALVSCNECPAGLSLGIPPANRAPSCGGPAIGTLLPAPEGGTGATLGPRPPPFPESSAGPLRSLVTVFFSDFPAWICFSSSADAMEKV